MNVVAINVVVAAAAGAGGGGIVVAVVDDDDDDCDGDADGSSASNASWNVVAWSTYTSQATESCRLECAKLCRHGFAESCQCS